MFRAIHLHPDDRKFHHIFWRYSSDEPVEEWEHTRVIFGATCSPFLAQRTILQLLQDEGSKFPLAAEALRSSMYVDDVLTGADSESAAIELRVELTDLLKMGGFELGKWASSNDNVIQSDTSHEIATGSTTIKVLGLLWNPRGDCFSYKIQMENEIPTKRGVLSRIARTYDVNGYLSPFTFSLKALMQQLWLLKLDWVEPLPHLIADQWRRITEELPLLEMITIPRCILHLGWSTARLIGFSDASSLGMAAVLYLRLQVGETVHLTLLAAKTRVAPLKSWSIPRLELGAASLLSKLLISVKPSLTALLVESPVCFTDSSTTLAWLKTPPYLLKTFVAHRVAQIHELSPEVQWRHVPGKHNPADPASRGLLPSELFDHPLWWNGPAFIYETGEEWPNPPPHMSSSLPELKQPEVRLHLASIDYSELISLFERYSSLLKLQRVISYTKRFVHNCRAKAKNDPDFPSWSGPISAMEYRQSLDVIIRITQLHYLQTDIALIKKGSLCSKRYRPLSPFLSSQGFVMVGGRLKYADLPERARHPYLVPQNSHLAVLLVDHFHIYSGHGGPRLVQSLLHREFWIPSLRDLIRRRLFRCLVCYRFKAPPLQPRMADLPSCRLKPSRCFTNTGVDFAGPFLVKASLLRSTQRVKCYMALFVCMVTKAVHLEAVTDLTTNACFGAIDRFTSRRGLPAHIFSDQGRNFKGCAREISEISKFLDTSNVDIVHYLAIRKIEWHFNPPYAPHFGGLWESGVKSTKHHLKRIIGSQVLTFEEFSTILARVEGILNSRPLCAISNSPDDEFDCLTPGHFLIGSAILAKPEPSLLNIPENRLNRWQLAQHIVQSFWKKWSSEYLHTQMCRPKWVAPARSLGVGDLVFWCNPGMLPTEWPRGRVQELLPGKDGVTRVVRIRTAHRLEVIELLVIELRN